MLYMDNCVTAHYLEPGSKKEIDNDNRNESALFLAMGARYFASKHGIPLFALRIINEPKSKGRGEE